jgi:glycosyltransferase involved in cell wall biosynthesis
MHVLLVTQYFHPEVGATQTRMLEFARGLTAKGHDVTVLTEFPNHPHGVIPDAYRGKLFTTERMEGFTVLRTWVWATPVKTFWSRIAFYLSFMILAIVRGMLYRPRVDAVLATSPPLFSGVVGWVLSRWKGAKFVLDVRDLWPAAAEALGELRHPFLVRRAEFVERRLYRAADCITAVTKAFCAHIASVGADESKIRWLPNGTVEALFTPERLEAGLKAQLGLGGRFVVTFAGTHGIAQGLPAVLDAAKHLAGHPVTFFFIGDGPVKAALVERARTEGLDNVVFHAQVPLDRIAPYLNLSDALLVPLRNDPIFSSFVPSKLFDSMACGKPVILMVDGEARQLLDQASGGIYVPAEDACALADAVRWLRAHPDESVDFGRRGREFVLAHFTRARQAEELENLLSAVVR